MARYLAIGEKPGLKEEEFRGAFDQIRKWRIDRQSWVIKAYLGTDSGKLVIECETPERARFEEWLSKAGWQVDAIHQIDLIHEAGTVWDVSNRRAS
jgi:hypothetical protein